MASPSARRGAFGLAGATVALAVVAAVAFDAAFEVFHRLFFSGGTYTFDPAKSTALLKEAGFHLTPRGLRMRR